MNYPFLMQILVATSNDHKLKELQSLFPGHTLILPKDFGINYDCEENGKTFEENSLIKAQALFKACNGQWAVLADDSGLTVDALPGQLGIHTARYGSPDNTTILSSDEKNSLLLKNMEGIEDSKRTARFTCVLTLISANGKKIVSKGIAEGRILCEKTGLNGFGYDPVFFCNEANSPFALLSEQEKNIFSHRAKAAKQLLELIKGE